MPLTEHDGFVANDDTAADMHRTTRDAIAEALAAHPDLIVGRTPIPAVNGEVETLTNRRRVERLDGTQGVVYELEVQMKVSLGVFVADVADAPPLTPRQEAVQIGEPLVRFLHARHMVEILRDHLAMNVRTAVEPLRDPSTMEYALEGLRFESERAEERAVTPDNIRDVIGGLFAASLQMKADREAADKTAATAQGLVS